MREDQFVRLQALTEKLAEAFIVEADPDHWSGAGKLPQEMDKGERGDRYWCKRNASATAALLLRVGSLTAMVVKGNAGDLTPGSTDEPGEDPVESMVSQAEALGSQLLDQVLKSQRRAEATAKLHGKP